MSKDKLTGRISYRLGGQVFKQVERQAAAQNISANEWCRQAVIEKLRSQSQAMPRAETSQAALPWMPSQSQALTKIERILLEEILRIRFLIHHGVHNHVGSRTGLTAEGWQSIITQANGGPAFKDMVKKWLEAYRPD